MMDSYTKTGWLHTAILRPLAGRAAARLSFLIFAVVLFWIPLAVSACPNCKEGFEAGSANAAVGDAYSLSVIFMLAVPATLVTVFTIVLTRRLRSIDRK